MKIGWVVSGGFDESGREHVTPSRLWLVERLARRHEVIVIVLDYHDAPREYPLLGARIADVGRTGAPPGLRLPHLYLKLAGAVRRHGPFDLLHGFWGVPAGVLTALVARRTGVPSVITFNSGEFACLPEIGYGQQRAWRTTLLVRTAAHLASSVTVASEFMRTLASQHGVDAHLLPMGVDLATFSRSRDSQDRPVARCVEGPPWRLLQVANLNPVKDQSTLLTALAIAIRREKGIHLDLVGVDTLNGRMHALAGSLGIADHVTFHGFRTSDELVDLYARAHLYVQSSQHEAAGISVLEAAASGVPIVGTNVGHLADFAPHAAIAVPPGSAQALADAIVTTLRDKRRREVIAAAAYTWAVAHDADWTATEMERLYERLTRSYVKSWSMSELAF